jgi:hypothetical protein
MMSERKTVRELLKELGPEYEEWLANDEDMSEMLLASRMIWGLIVSGKRNEEVCKWAGEVSANLMFALAPEGIHELIGAVKLRRTEGKSPEEIGKELRENSKEIWSAYTDRLSQAVAKLIAESTKT